MERRARWGSVPLPAVAAACAGAGMAACGSASCANRLELRHRRLLLRTQPLIMGSWLLVAMYHPAVCALVDVRASVTADRADKPAGHTDSRSINPRIWPNEALRITFSFTEDRLRWERLEAAIPAGRFDVLVAAVLQMLSAPQRPRACCAALHGCSSKTGGKTLQGSGVR